MGVAVFPAAGGGVTQKVQAFTSTGTFTVPSNCSTVEVLLVGGGGGGGGCQVLNGTVGIACGGGGGGAGVLRRTLTVTPGASITVTIGAGGAGGVGNSTWAGAVGSDSTFGSLLTAKGGGGGGSNNRGGSQTTAMLASSGASGGGSAGWSDGGTDTVGGGGGGINENGYNRPRYYSDQPTFAANLWTYGGPGNGLFGGGSGSFAQTGGQRGWTYAGSGIDGFGGGGAGGQWPDSTTASGFNIALGVTPGGNGVGVANTAVNGSSGTANTGNGGGGSVAAANTSPSRTANGGAGGSGYCIVTYWS